MKQCHYRLSDRCLSDHSPMKQCHYRLSDRCLSDHCLSDHSPMKQCHCLSRILLSTYLGNSLIFYVARSVRFTLATGGAVITASTFTCSFTFYLILYNNRFGRVLSYYLRPSCVNVTRIIQNNSCISSFTKIRRWFDAFTHGGSIFFFLHFIKLVCFTQLPEAVVHYI